MAKSNTLIVELDSGNKTIYNTTAKVKFTDFINIPSSLVAGTGHIHDTLYMPADEVTFLFQAEKDKIDVLSSRIEVLGYKTNIIMNGGGSNDDARLRNYNIGTEVSSLLTPSVGFSTVKGSGMSFQRFGYFMNDAKKINKFDHFTLTATTVSDSAFIVKNTLIDFAVQSKGYIFDGATKATEVNILLNTYITKPDIAHKGNFGIGLSSFTYGFLKGQTNSLADMLKRYSYSASTISEVVEFNINSEVSALQKNSKVGYWLGSNNFKHSYTTDSISQISGATQVNSNNTANDIFGVLVSGSNSTTTTKLGFSTDTFSVMTANSTDTTQSSFIES